MEKTQGQTSILIIKGDGAQAKSVQALLQQHGFSVQEAADRRQALDLINGQRAKVLLSGKSRPVTARRQHVEQAFQEYAAELEEMGDERPPELHEAQEHLTHQEKLAIFGQVAGGLGHELRNPLAAIKNVAYFLTMVLQDPSADVAEALQILELEVGTCDRIIGSLLAYARPKLPRLVPVDLAALVQATLDHLVIPEQIQVVARFDESLPRALADADGLAIIFENIIRNAVQAMAGGGRLLIAGGTDSVRGAPTTKVTFHDTGTGILPEDIDRIFEPLFTTKAKGIGLGLVLSRQLLEGMGGNIEVTSDVGEGSTFTVRLPPYTG